MVLGPASVWCRAVPVCPSVGWDSEHEVWLRDDPRSLRCGASGGCLIARIRRLLAWFLVLLLQHGYTVARARKEQCTYPAPILTDAPLELGQPVTMATPHHMAPSPHPHPQAPR